MSDRYARRRAPVQEYRWRCGKRNGLWHDNEAGAGEAAVRAGLATWEGKQLYLGPLVEIEQRIAPARRSGPTNHA